MPEINVGKFADFEDPGRKVVDCNGTEVGVFRLGSDVFAYHNICPHLDGPACQGKILPLATEDVAPDQTSAGRVYSKSQVNVICPWHGFEFDIRTGRHPTDPEVRLRPVPVRIEGGNIVITLPR
jgi:nitrite reductase/ring-hydroxylating ferredoxin subunit